MDVGERVVSAELSLLEPHPNPMRLASVIVFRLARPGVATLRIVDVQGRRVRELAKGMLAAGPHEARWDGVDENGRSVAAGVYFVTLDAEDRSVVRRLAVVR